MSFKIGVGALIFNETNKILLMYRTKNCNIYKNCWFIPCGTVEDCENPKDAIIREVKEETSLEVEVIKEVYKKRNERGTLEIGYLCKIVEGTPIIMEPEKCAKLGYFSLDEGLPKNTGKRTLEVINSYKTTNEF